MNGRIGNPDRPRGRPRQDQRGDIPDDLMRALREVLLQKPANEVTVREIAASAGTSPEMVRYYFNGKDGLIAALLDDSLVRVRARLDRLGADLALAKEGHSTLIVACLATLYLEEREAGKLFNSEFARMRSRTPAIHGSARQDTIISVLHGQIGRLMERGIYRSTLDPARVAILIMSLTGCPVRLLDTLGPRWISEECMREADWINDVATMVDCFCLAGTVMRSAGDSDGTPSGNGTRPEAAAD